MPTLTKKRLVLLALLAALVLIPLLVIGWNVFPIHRELPDGVTVEAVETTYPELLDRLATAGPGGAGTAATDVSKDRDLVAPPEILEAKVGRNNGYMVIGNKTLALPIKDWSLYLSPARQARHREMLVHPGGWPQGRSCRVPGNGSRSAVGRNGFSSSCSTWTPWRSDLNPSRRSRRWPMKSRPTHRNPPPACPCTVLEKRQRPR